MVLSGRVGGGGALTPNTADGRELSTSTQVGAQFPLADSALPSKNRQSEMTTLLNYFEILENTLSF